MRRVLFLLVFIWASNASAENLYNKLKNLYENKGETISTKEVFNTDQIWRGKCVVDTNPTNYQPSTYYSYYFLEADDVVAREKVGQLFRNSNSTKYKSSSAKKHKRRLVANSQVARELHDILKNNAKVGPAMEAFQRTVAAINISQLSDKVALDLFDSHNRSMLELLKSEKSLSDK